MKRLTILYAWICGFCAFSLFGILLAQEKDFQSPDRILLNALKILKR